MNKKNKTQIADKLSADKLSKVIKRLKERELSDEALGAVAGGGNWASASWAQQN